MKPKPFCVLNHFTAPALRSVAAPVDERGASERKMRVLGALNGRVKTRGAIGPWRMAMLRPARRDKRMVAGEGGDGAANSLGLVFESG